MHPRSTAVIVSSVYLFGPMLFGSDIEGKVEAPAPPPMVIAGSMGDMATGMGGPLDPLIILQRSPIPKDRFIFEDRSTTTFPGTNEVVEPFGPKVTVTKTYNYMKVANTVMPVTDPTVSSGYGWRTPPCPRCSADHKGVDFVPGYETPVFAVAAGMVIHLGYGGEYGYYIILKHLIANGEGIIEEWETLYAHLKKDSFTEGLIIGSVVNSGDVIGAVGNTGLSTGPHLHFELKINGTHVDPLPLLGTYEILIVTEEEYPDYMFVGETFKVVKTEITYGE